MMPPASLIDASQEVFAVICPQPTDLTHRIFVEVMGGIFNHLPQHYWGDEPKRGTLYIPLYDAVDHCGETILDAMLPIVKDKELLESGQLYELRRTLLENEARSCGLSMYERRKKWIPSPHERDEPPRELCFMYFKDTPFLDLFNTPIPFEIPRDRWHTHAVIIAPSEWGKSELIGSFLREAIEDPEPRAIFLLDPHGDLMKKALPRIPPERLVVIDPDTNPPDLNLLDYGVLSESAAQETFKFLMSSLAGGLTPKQEGCIGPLFALLKNIDGANLITLYDIITEQTKSAAKSAFAEPISRLPTIHRRIFENLFYTGNFQETKDALQWKISRALEKPAFEKMFSAKHNSIDMWRFVQERKVVLVKGGEKALGKEGMRLFLLFLIGQYYAVGKRRDEIPEGDRHLAMMFVDEASNVLQSPIISDILIELRKYYCGFVAATQLWQHIAEDVRPAILGSCGTRIVGKLGHDETSALYHDMETQPEVIKGLKNFPGSFAQWCFYVRSVTKKGTVVSAPYGMLEAMPKQKAAPRLTDEELMDVFVDGLKADPAARKQQQNELSLRDTELPLPEKTTHTETSEVVAVRNIAPSDPKPISDAEEELAKQLNALYDDIKREENADHIRSERSADNVAETSEVKPEKKDKPW